MSTQLSFPPVRLGDEAAVPPVRGHNRRDVRIAGDLGITEGLRWHERVVTPWGPVRVKIGARKGEVLQVAPELEDVKAVATASGRSAGEVHRAALAAWAARGTT